MAGDGAGSFHISGQVYDRHIGRYGAELGRALIDFAGVSPGNRVLDVGCGTGLLTAELAALVGPPLVAAVDPSEPLLASCRERVPGADVRVAAAESLPFDDASFDAVLSQLVLNFLAEPGPGLAEMRRVTRPGGVIACCVWDYAEGMTLLRAFWDAARATDPSSVSLDEGITMSSCSAGGLSTLWTAAGLHDVRTAALTTSAGYRDFDDLWQPLLAGVAPSGAYVAGLSAARRDVFRDELRRRLGSPRGPFRLTARAWAVVGQR